MRRLWLVAVAALSLVVAPGHARAQLYVPTYADILASCSSCLISHYSLGELEHLSQSQLTNLLSATISVSNTKVLDQSVTPAFLAIAFPGGTLSGGIDPQKNAALQNYFNNNFVIPLNNIVTQAPGAPVVYTGVQPVSATIRVDGLNILGNFAANSTTFDLSIPDLKRFGPNGFLMSFPGVDRTAALQSVASATLSQSQITDLEQAIIAYWASSQGSDALAGNPASVQSMLVRDSLNLSDPGSVLDSAEYGHGGSDAGNWMVGAAYGRASSQGAYTNNVDAVLHRNWRVFEGSRSLLQVSVPLSYSDAYGVKEFQGGASLGLEVPVIEGRWSLAPHVGWGATAANRIQSMGHLDEVSLTSRIRIDGVGRGYFIIGNMIGHTETLSTRAAGVDLNPHIANWVYRNGVAYEFPLKMMKFGRGLSARASFVQTDFTGSPLFLERYREASLSVGVRAREGKLDNSYELMRVGLNATWGSRYTMFKSSIGFRF